MLRTFRLGRIAALATLTLSRPLAQSPPSRRTPARHPPQRHARDSGARGPGTASAAPSGEPAIPELPPAPPRPRARARSAGAPPTRWRTSCSPPPTCRTASTPTAWWRAPASTSTTTRSRPTAARSCPRSGTATRRAGRIIVFDFRMAFPSAEDAAAYLDDAEATISERDTSGTRRWSRTRPPSATTIACTPAARRSPAPRSAFHNHLFTVGPVAAKVFVSAYGDDRRRDRRRDRARPPRTRMAASQSGGPLVTPEPSGPPPSTRRRSPRSSRRSSWPTSPDDITDCEPVRTPAFHGRARGHLLPVGDGGERLVMRQLDSADEPVRRLHALATSPAGDDGTCRPRPRSSRAWTAASASASSCATTRRTARACSCGPTSGSTSCPGS